MPRARARRRYATVVVPRAGIRSRSSSSTVTASAASAERTSIPAVRAGRFRRKASSSRAIDSRRGDQPAALAVTLVMRGSVLGRPLCASAGVAAIDRTASIPSITLPKAVYWPSRCWQWSRPRQTKNWLPAESGCAERAIERTPSSCLRSLNSAFTFQPGPPVPSPRGQPPWMTKPGMMRWKARLS